MDPTNPQAKSSQESESTADRVPPSAKRREALFFRAFIGSSARGTRMDDSWG